MIKNLLSGYRRFYAAYFQGDRAIYRKLAKEGQSPETLIISCCDARVDPSILVDADPGDIFVIRNVANLVPPYQPDWSSYHGTSAAIEFAVCGLQVANIVVLGHSGCGGIKLLVDGDEEGKFRFVSDWMKIAEKACHPIPQHVEGADCYRHSEQAAIGSSLQNLMTFPWIKERVMSKKLTLHGWYFSLEDGTLLTRNLEDARFVAVGTENEE